jgi:ADP-ribosylglycohydrolase
MNTKDRLAEAELALEGLSIGDAFGEQFFDDPWRTASRALFGGVGSYGNGAAMRAAPVGGYFFDAIDRCVEAAVASAVPTHAHPDGVAGAVSVAVAGSLLTEARRSNRRLEGEELLTTVLAHAPQGGVRAGIEQALALGGDAPSAEAGVVLGSGSEISAADTVPFCLWVTAWHQASVVEALWTTVAALGDRDTTCAIVGGLVALARGTTDLPATWREAREPLRR